jgi:copper transport protein
MSVSGDNPKIGLVILPHQPDGVYSLGWQVQSAVDGHFTGGSIAFSVGNSSPKASLLPPPGAPDPATDLPSFPDVLFRGLSYFSISLVFGAVVFGGLVWQPAMRKTRPAAASTDWDAFFVRMAQTILFWGAIAGILSLIGLKIWQEFKLSALNGPGQFGANLVNGRIDRTTWVALAQLFIFFILMILADTFTESGADDSSPWLAGIGLGALLLLTYALSGHNAAAGSIPGVIGDWLHLTSMGAWMGGLLPLGILLFRERRLKAAEASRADDSLALVEPAQPEAPFLAGVTRRFSRIATFAVIVLALTGIYSALIQVQTLAALTGTRYGQAILIKSALFAVLIGFGAINQLRIMPRMLGAGTRAFEWLGRSVRMEFLIALVLLLMVGALMSLAPGSEALQADYRAGLHETYQANQVKMDFRVAPAKVGENEFGVDISDHRPNADGVKPTVLLRIQAADGSTGQTQVAAAPDQNGRFTARGSYFSRMGIWQVLVIWRKDGFDDITHVFTVDLQQIALNRGDKETPLPAGSASR